MSVAAIKTDKQALILKPPEEVEEVYKKAREKYGLKVRLTYTPLDLGRTVAVAAEANSKYIAELIGIKYDKLEVHPKAHPKTIADLMFYLDKKIVAKVQVHLCFDSTRAEECIRTIKKKIRRDEFYILIMAAEFQKVKDGPYDRGMFLFLMEYNYLRQNTAETIWEDMLRAVDLLRDHLGYNELYITGFIDRYITLSIIAEFVIKDIERDLQDIKNRMVTKEDLERFEKEILMEISEIKKILKGKRKD